MKRLHPVVWILLALAAAPMLYYAVAGVPAPAGRQGGKGAAQQQQQRSQPQQSAPRISDLIARARRDPGSISLVVFDPNTRKATTKLAGGPPGTGKTLLARFVAECERRGCMQEGGGDGARPATATSDAG